MPKRYNRRTEEQTRFLLQRGLELYRRRIRQRASAILREFLGVERLPRALTFRDVLDLVEAVFRGYRRVPWMYEWTLRYRGRWLAIKWAWYIRNKTYWREKFEKLAREIEVYRRMYRMATKYPYDLLAHMSAWMDSYTLTEPELCTARQRFGDLAEILTRVRRLVLLDSFYRAALAIRGTWPNRMYRVVLFLTQRNRMADVTAEKGGAYFRDIGYGSGKYWVYSFRVYGKQVPQLIRQFEDDLEAAVLWTLDPPPAAENCI